MKKSLIFVIALLYSYNAFSQINCKGRVFSEGESLYKMHLFNATGTGFLISNNGHILTNRHVIENGDNLTVTFIVNGNKVTRMASLIYIDKNADLAVLKADIGNLSLKPVPYNFSFGEENLGADVYILGYPIPGLMGQNIKLTDGIISSKSGFQDDTTMYQISAPIQPGNSGSPIFNKAGNVIGVAVSSLTAGQNVNYGIKSKLLKDVFKKVGLKPNIDYNKNSKISKLDHERYVCLISAETIRRNYPLLVYKENNMNLFNKSWFETNENGCYGDTFTKYLESVKEETFEKDISALLVYKTYQLNMHWNFQTLYHKVELLYEIGAYENVINECQSLNPYSKKNDEFDMLSYYAFLFPWYIKANFRLNAPYSNPEIISLTKEINLALDFTSTNSNFDLKNPFYINLKASYLAYLGYCHYVLGDKNKACTLINEARKLDNNIDEYPSIKCF